MNLSDIIALAKAGYKPKDIKELIELGKEAQTTGAEEPAETDPKEDPQPEPEKAPAEPASADPGAIKIKELEAQLAQVRQDLAKAQRNNTSRDNSGAAGPEDPQAVLNDIARKFM